MSGILRLRPYDAVENDGEITIDRATGRAYSQAKSLAFLSETAGAANSINFVPDAPVAGTATGGSDTTLVDTGASWTIDEFVGRVVELDNDVITYAVVLSNTSTVITFDATLAHAVENGVDYKILDTVILADSDLNVIVAIDARDYSAGVLLPKSVAGIERQWAHVYIEMGNNHVGICTREDDTFLGNKWGTLENQYEGVRFYCHTWTFDHWDVLSTYNVKRFACGKVAAQTAVDSTSYIEVNANVENILSKRFALDDVSGQKTYRYTSLVPTDFLVCAEIQILKTGGSAGEITATFRHYDADDNATDLTAFEGTTRFGNGEGAGVLSLSVPVSLKIGERISLIAKRTAQTFSIEAGTTINIKEL